jgi:MFS family permease
MPRAAPLFTPVLLVGCVIIVASFGIRAAFGVFQIPIADEFGWLRTEFSLAIAIQNLAWGIGQPIFGALADKFGDRRAIVLGTLIYVLGLVLSAGAVTPLALQAYNVLIGFGIAGTGFGVILAVVGRAASDQNRAMAMAIAAAAGSVGQIVGPPAAQALLQVATWQVVFVIFAGTLLATLALLPFMRAPAPPSRAELEETLNQILGRAFRDPTFTLIAIGFFSCGYQIGFITAHFPAFVTEFCGPINPDGFLASIGIASTSALGALSLALIGAANIAGTLAAGWAGSRFPKKYLLAGIYAGRVVLSVAFILTPMTPLSVVVFALLMGTLWLATIPLTSGLVGYIYGLRYMGTLYGFVFLSHQIGAFIGVWLGGRMFDAFGNYVLVWWIGIAVGVISALVHFPVRERPIGAAVAV